ncbi:hypothetical protein A0U92_13045 [Acetobacter aceti]|uniref:Uncharacterized protein n=1 Tax=Acetobacter aceti TaxID=435 RepID=A0A1U9KIB0_ACEAC|nr:hypothetical protein A0U92_13045 [Acetobacter aceti]
MSIKPMLSQECTDIRQPGIYVLECRMNTDMICGLKTRLYISKKNKKMETLSIWNGPVKNQVQIFIKEPFWI